MQTEDQNYEVTPDEMDEVVQIIYKFFLKEEGTEQKAIDRLNGLVQYVQQNKDAVFLVHIDNTIFVIMVNSPGVVEVHTMAIDSESSALARSFVKLSDYLKNLGVKMAYSYSDDPRFAAIARRTRLPIRTEKMQGPDGKEYTAYIQEFA